MTAIINGFRGKTIVSLGKQPFAAGGVASFKIPQDVVIKEFILVVNGYMSCTFAGTKPTVNPQGLSHGLLAEISVSRKGTDRLKSYRGTRKLKAVSERQFGQEDGTLYKVNATDLDGSHSEGLPVWGTTGQNVAFRESKAICFENKLSGSWYPTLFNTKNLQTATLNMRFGQLSDVQDPKDSNAGTYTGSIEVEVFASCCDYLKDDANIGNADWNENFQELEFSGTQTQSRRFINPQGMLQGMLITGVYDSNIRGGKPFTMKHMKNTRLEIKYEGILLAEGAMSDFLEIDSQKTMLSSRKEGQVYLSFLNNGAFDSGLYIADGKQLELIVSTDSAHDYVTNGPVKLIFEYDQIIFAPTAPKSVG